MLDQAVIEGREVFVATSLVKDLSLKLCDLIIREGPCHLEVLDEFFCAVELGGKQAAFKFVVQ